MELGCSCYEVAWGQGRNEGPGDVVGADLVPEGAEQGATRSCPRQGHRLIEYLVDVCNCQEPRAQCPRPWRPHVLLSEALFVGTAACVVVKSLGTGFQSRLCGRSSGNLLNLKTVSPVFTGNDGPSLWRSTEHRAGHTMSCDICQLLLLGDSPANPQPPKDGRGARVHRSHPPHGWYRGGSGRDEAM